MNESEETQEIKTFLLYSYLLQGQQALPNCKPISVGCPGDVRYTAPLPHPTIPSTLLNKAPREQILSLQSRPFSVVWHAVKQTGGQKSCLPWHEMTKNLPFYHWLLYQKLLTCQNINTGQCLLELTIPQ